MELFSKSELASEMRETVSIFRHLRSRQIATTDHYYRGISAFGRQETVYNNRAGPMKRAQREHTVGNVKKASCYDHFAVAGVSDIITTNVLAICGAF